ncbi:DUF7665 family protein [Anatilimnocola sp. NA78]|uniref:DUF7665 family protein n=1 Tax=Anatilimnocola sp. NA78 TaxID=3415683 RepID=UPI003CE5B507
MRPDERSFRDHIAAGAFQLGAHQGRWKLGSIAWPIVQIAVAAATREGAPNEYWFRFDCSGYSQDAPTARPWDHETDQPLPFGRWPNGASRIPAVFRTDWKDGTCLYLPCDRIAAVGHDNWRNEYPALQWSPSRGVVLYLNELHSLLNSSDYKGVRGG